MSEAKYAVGLNVIDAMNETDLPEPRLVVSPGTPLACTCCHRMNMPAYYLKRSNGKYEVLCFANGQGCWERSSRTLCTYTDSTEQCMDLAEFAVTYGAANDMTRRAVCSRHIPAVMSGAPEYRIYPIDEDMSYGR